MTDQPAPDASEDPAADRTEDADGPEAPETAEVPSTDEIAAEMVEAEGRRYPSTIGGAFYLAVMAVAGVGILVAWLDDWRLGVRVLAGALIGAATLRLVLRERDAGMLKVRHRLVDVGLLAAVGAALLFLAQTIPDQPL